MTRATVANGPPVVLRPRLLDLFGARDGASGKYPTPDPDFPRDQADDRGAA